MTELHFFAPILMKLKLPVHVHIYFLLVKLYFMVYRLSIQKRTMSLISGLSLVVVLH